MASPIEPPRITDRNLFDEADDWWANTILQLQPTDWWSYAVSYRTAADALAEQFPPWRPAPNGMPLPILFLYRHYIELSLKGILRDCRELLDNEGKMASGHDLGRLWESARTELLRVYPQESHDWLGRAQVLIAQFEELDPFSTAFRYPVDKKGAPSLPDQLVVALGPVKSVIEELAVVLDRAFMMCSAFVEVKREGL
jgi:hypothetical protein